MVAIKRLHSSDRLEFQKEETILKAVAPLKHLHLIQLYATYQHESKWHLIFPWANGNLRTFWKEIPQPELDGAIVKWSLNQMGGLADGLENVHTCPVKISLTPGGAGNVRVLNEGATSITLSVETGEQWYGRHGDIKPENVLWFRDDPDIPGEKDVLKLADFGLGRFHGRDTRSKVDPKTIAYSPTYEPPEVWLGTPVSRAYDIWSLGCLYLEFLTWLQMGYEAIEAFADRRLQGTFQSFYDDSFYTITTDLETGAKKADIREGVRSWVQELHTNERCSQFMHDLLDVVMKNMLLVESKSRIDATSLYQTFVRFKDRAREDKDYLLAPRPWPSCIDSVRLEPNTSQRKVRFDEHAVDSSSSNLSGKLNKSGTWATVP